METGKYLVETAVPLHILFLGIGILALLLLRLHQSSIANQIQYHLFFRFAISLHFFFHFQFT